MIRRSLSKKFLIIFFLTSLWFVLAFWASSDVFHAGIYSCHDAVFLQCDGRNCSALETTAILNQCRTSQNIGNIIFLIHFLPAIVMGVLTNQLIFLLIPNLDGVRFGIMVFSIGFIPTVLLQIFLIAQWIYLRRQRKHGRTMLGNRDPLSPSM